MNSRKHKLLRAGLYLVIGGLVLRAAIPTGYMPGSLLAGEFMVFCPSGGGALFLQQMDAAAPTSHAHHVAITLQGASAPATSANSAGVDSHCPIGKALQAALGGEFPIPEVGSRPLAAYIFSRVTRLFARPAISLNVARGPPVPLNSQI
jgi:hypothetical protein